MNSKLNPPTLLLILHLVYNTMGQRKFGLVGNCTLMTSRSCPLARARCKPCYMSARNGVFEIVCRSTHTRQKSWLSSRLPPSKRLVVASTDPAQPYPHSTSTRPSQPPPLALTSLLRYSNLNTLDSFSSPNSPCTSQLLKPFDAPRTASP